MRIIKRLLTIIWFSILFGIMALLISNYQKTHDSKVFLAIWFYLFIFIALYALAVCVVLAVHNYVRKVKQISASVKIYGIKGKEPEKTKGFKVPVTRYKLLNELLNWFFSFIGEKNRLLFDAANKKKSFKAFWTWFTTPSISKPKFIVLSVLSVLLIAAWCFLPYLLD